MKKKKYCFTVLFIVLCSLTQAQSIKFDSIVVSSNIDSLQGAVKQNYGFKKLQSLLNLSQSLTYWERNKANKYIFLLKEIVKNFPESKAHYYYFRSRYELVNSGNNVAAFNFAKTAFQEYSNQKDTTGIIAALVNLGIITAGTAQDLNDNTKFTHKYLLEASELSKKYTKPLANLIGKYGLIRYYGIDFRPDSQIKMISLAKEGLAIIKNNTKYEYLRYLFLDALAMIYSVKEDYAKAQFYNLQYLHLFQANKKDVSLTLLNNIGYQYLKLKKYNLSIKYYKKALANMPIDKKSNYSIIRHIFNGYHGALVALSRYKEASSLTDSIYLYSEKFHKTENSKQLDELVVKYELQKKITENLILQNDKERIESKNELYLIAGTLTAIALLIVAYLALGLNKANTNLKLAIKEIDQLNKIREHFFSIIAHDLRRPLHAFQGMADLVNYYLQTKRYDAIAQLSISIDESGQRIRQMLDNLLVWAVSQREEIPYNPIEVNLWSKIQYIVSFYENTLIKNPVQFKVNCPISINAFVDSESIDLILRNVIDNSLKSITYNGMISIDVFYLDPKSVLLRVSDNGSGIDTTKLNNIKEMIDNISNSHPGQHGVGLGFILIARFLKRNHGTIELESSLSAGTKLTIILPSLEFPR